jgi:1-acyl-sn-glycerol-3-phosphate acyltransferase
MTDKSKNIVPQYLHVEKVLSDKSPLLKKVLPEFVIRYLKKITHQDQLNQYLKDFVHLQGVDFIEAVLNEMNTKLNIVGAENVPVKERCLVASNHPLGGLDGLALMLAVGRIRRDLLFPVNDILMNIENLKPLFIPINKHGSNTQNIEILNETFASDNIICYFPFGLVSRKKKGEVKDLLWRSTFITKSIKYKRDIIPTHIDGRNTNFFYNLSNFRKALGIRLNIEMLYLVDEFYKKENTTLKITFGPRIPYQTFDNRYIKYEWSEMLRQYSYKLGDGYTKPFDPNDF